MTELTAKEQYERLMTQIKYRLENNDFIHWTVEFNRRIKAQFRTMIMKIDLNNHHDDKTNYIDLLEQINNLNDRYNELNDLYMKALPTIKMMDIVFDDLTHIGF